MLGIVRAEDNDIKKLYDEKYDEIVKKLQSIADKYKEEVKGMLINNNSYESQSDCYAGIFWEWSNRRTLSIDDQVKNPYVVAPDSNAMLKKETYEVLKDYFPGIEPEEIKFYEARLYT